MPAKNKVVPVIPEPLTCGACRFGHVSKNTGDLQCFGSPPQLLWNDNDDLMSMRPPVRKDDPACHIFQPRLNS